MYEIFLEIVWFVESLGYLGIFIMTFVESTFIPIPAEITLIPAGYLVHKGEMHGLLVLVVSSIGTLGGSLANYYIAYFFGRKLFTNKGKYFFINQSKLEKKETTFWWQQTRAFYLISCGSCENGFKTFLPIHFTWGDYLVCCFNIIRLCYRGK